MLSDKVYGMESLFGKSQMHIDRSVSTIYLQNVDVANKLPAKRPQTKEKGGGNLKKEKRKKEANIERV